MVFTKINYGFNEKTPFPYITLDQFNRIKTFAKKLNKENLITIIKHKHGIKEDNICQPDFFMIVNKYNKLNKMLNLSIKNNIHFLSFKQISLKTIKRWYEISENDFYNIFLTDTLKYIQVINILKEKNKALYALLIEGTPYKILSKKTFDANIYKWILYIDFPKEKEFHKEALYEKRNLLKSIIYDVSG
ncbi:MAG: hypothetical protein ACOCP8_08460, partial [archaeon]